MLSENAYRCRKIAQKVPVEKSVENVENSALSTVIPIRSTGRPEPGK